ncbi:MAG: IMPACT family protein [Saprospiraceae bacterium]
MTDSYQTIAGPSTGEFKDRGSKFIAYAWPVRNETEAQSHLEKLRKEHFKARHHCFAWRFEPDGSRFRSNDDGEPSGTAGRPILGQIDSFSLTNVMVVVVRYFGGTLLGTSGLINAYREAAAEALRNAEIVECLVKDSFLLDFDYALMPDVMNALKKLEIELVHQNFEQRGQIEIGIRQSETAAMLLRFKAHLWKVSEEEAEGVDWPSGLEIKQQN